MNREDEEMRYKMENLIEFFCDALQANGKSKHTIKAYRANLKMFREFFIDRQINSIHYTDLQVWVNQLDGKGLSTGSRAQQIASVKSFFRFLAKMEVITSNPAELLDSPKLETRQPTVISTADANKLLFFARNSGGRDMLWFRDYTILAMFLFTGIRREELTNIRLTDIDLNNGAVLIHGKGNKQRKVYISKTLHAILSEYVMYYRTKLPKAEESEFLFPSLKSEKVCIATVSNIVNRFFEEAGIKTKGVSAHALRKRFATSVFEQTHDIATVSKMLGHSTPTVTMRYIAIDEENMKKATSCVNF